MIILDILLMLGGLFLAILIYTGKSVCNTQSNKIDKFAVTFLWLGVL